MGSHAFNLVVVGFWLTTMSWLVMAKIVPPLRVGEPPSYSSILEQEADDPPVCWSIRLHDRTMGWAISKVEHRDGGISELQSRVYLQDLPLEEFAPAWLGTVLKPVLGDLGPLDVDKKSRMVVDPLGRLVGFESRVRIAEIPDAIKVQGQTEGASLKLTVQSGEIPYKFERYLPVNALMTDELSPQANLPGLRVGQRWTVPLYSPFRAPSSPIEILQATVDRADHITWNGQTVNCRVIVFRDDPGSGLVSGDPRGRMWVREDGLVLRQEVAILRSHLHFLRLSQGEAELVAAALGDDWMGPLSNTVAQRLLDHIATQSP